MWTCPECGHKFYNTGQSHSCGNYTVEDFLGGKPKNMVELFHHFIAAYRTIGSFEIHPVKTRVALLTKMRFCSINKIGADHIDGHLVFVEPYGGTGCFYRIDNLQNRFFVHHFRLYEKEDVNEELKRYMAMAYRIGEREHVKEKRKKAQ